RAAVAGLAEGEGGRVEVGGTQGLALEVRVERLRGQQVGEAGGDGGDEAGRHRPAGAVAAKVGGRKVWHGVRIHGPVAASVSLARFWEPASETLAATGRGLVNDVLRADVGAVV